jgi:hypothetical protein
MRKLLSFFFAWAVTVGASVSAFGQMSPTGAGGTRVAPSTSVGPPTFVYQTQQNTTSWASDVGTINATSIGTARSVCFPRRESVRATRLHVDAGGCGSLRHLAEHLPHIGEAQPSVPVLFQEPQLSGGNLVFLDRVVPCGVEGAHVGKKGTRYGGRQLDRFAGHTGI